MTIVPADEVWLLGAVHWHWTLGYVPPTATSNRIEKP
jgi:hypothetical protein